MHWNRSNATSPSTHLPISLLPGTTAHWLPSQAVQSIQLAKVKEESMGCSDRHLKGEETNGPFPFTPAVAEQVMAYPSPLFEEEACEWC